jgi:HAD superfamily hydrolase (TIGR01509 family)
MIIKGVLFDFDGTLTLPGALDFPAIKERLGCPPDEPVLEYLETQPATRRVELTKILEEFEEGAAETSRPNNGAEKCLSSLKKKGFLLGILTRNRLSSVERALEKFDGISIRDFAAVVTREVSLPKPNPEGVFKAAREMGLLPEELLVVGDFRFDVMAGKAAGAKTVFLTNDGRSLMSQGDPEPDYTFSYLEELLEIL